MQGVVDFPFAKSLRPKAGEFLLPPLDEGAYGSKGDGGGFAVEVALAKGKSSPTLLC
jgi:hypothetical protein